MYRIDNIGAIASVTELRSDTDETIEQAEETGRGVLIQKNNEPIAVLVSVEQWREIQGEESKTRR